MQKIIDQPTKPPLGADGLEASALRASTWAGEPFLHEDEDLAVVLAPGTARRRALDEAIAEIEAGKAQPTPDWRVRFALMLGLERILSEKPPHLASGTELRRHQIDALAGMLTELIAANQPAPDNGNGHAVFTVAPNASPALLPAPGAEIDAIDFGFRGASTLHDGEVVRFKNDGYLIHMFVFDQAKSLADAKLAEQGILSGKCNGGGQCKQYSTGVKGEFVGPLSHAELQQEVVNEPPGVYVIVCLMNAEDGRDHDQLGMFRTITIVK